MVNDSPDTRIGRLEGRLDAVIASLESIETRQSKLLDKIDELVSDQNKRIGFAAAISMFFGAVGSWFLTHWSKG